jgi:tRNA(Ile)-lysidine synthase TilS/MesJ
MNAMGCLGWFIVASSGFFVVAAVGELVSGSRTSDTEPGVVAGLGIFFAITAYLGWRLIKNSQTINKPLLASPEQRILGLAKQNHGRITLAEVVLNCNLEVDQARNHLRQMVREGMAELHLSDSGDEVYAFAGFMPETKQTAKDPLE